jgi:SagB-type dehydrogenase family enzyme
MPDSLIDRSREFLKNNIRQTIDFLRTDQSRGAEPPPLEKPFASEGMRIRLVAPDQWQAIGQQDLVTAIKARRSHRDFSDKPLSREELSYLLWVTQGVRQRLNAATALRSVPSAGARHALETYLCVFNVDGLGEAVYRYLPLEHELLLEFREPRTRMWLVEGVLGQTFVGQAAVVFIWTAVPYRMEWRYGPAAHKLIALDAGHVCQNLYLACEAIGAGTCAVAAYHQDLMDRLVQVDGSNEFVVYLAPVGKLKPAGN